MPRRTVLAVVVLAVLTTAALPAGAVHGEGALPVGREVVQRQEALDRLADQITAAVPENRRADIPGYAGLTVDPEQGLLTVYWHGDVPERVTRLIAHPPAGITAQVRPAPYTLGRLRAARDRLVAAATAGEPGADWNSAAPVPDGTGLAVTYAPAVGAAAVRTPGGAAERERVAARAADLAGLPVAAMPAVTPQATGTRHNDASPWSRRGASSARAAAARSPASGVPTRRRGTSPAGTRSSLCRSVRSSTSSASPLPDTMRKDGTIMVNAITGRLTATLGVLALACGAAAAVPGPVPRGQALRELQQAIHQAGIGPATWHVDTVSAQPGDYVQTVEVIGSVDDARRALDARFPGQTRVVHGHVTSDLVWRNGHDYPLEGELQALNRPDFQIFKTGAAPDGRTTVGVVGDLDAARAYLTAHYPGRTSVHDNTAR
ncbi:hypothetical protein [Kitasatospora sp. NPDC094016]|uniref:hypothetical protein n=1 Tax=Kitasatospora sp. NPDC094016 TaxID=3154986 RepID=UPI0033344569